MVMDFPMMSLTACGSVYEDEFWMFYILASWLINHHITGVLIVPVVLVKELQRLSITRMMEMRMLTQNMVIKTFIVQKKKNGLICWVFYQDLVACQIPKWLVISKRKQSVTHPTLLFFSYLCIRPLYDIMASLLPMNDLPSIALALVLVPSWKSNREMET